MPSACQARMSLAAMRQCLSTLGPPPNVLKHCRIGVHGNNYACVACVYAKSTACACAGRAARTKTSWCVCCWLVILRSILEHRTHVWHAAAESTPAHADVGRVCVNDFETGSSANAQHESDILCGVALGRQSARSVTQTCVAAVVAAQHAHRTTCGNVRNARTAHR